MYTKILIITLFVIENTGEMFNGREVTVDVMTGDFCFWQDGGLVTFILLLKTSKNVGWNVNVSMK